VRKEPPECPELAVTALWETGTPGSRAMLPLGVDEATALVITDTQQAGLQPPTYALRPHPKKIVTRVDSAPSRSTYR
jgi:hypothetical protein